MLNWYVYVYRVLRIIKGFLKGNEQLVVKRKGNYMGLED